MKNIMKAKQTCLLETKTVRPSRFGIKIRYAELGGSENPPVLLLHGVPEKYFIPRNLGTSIFGGLKKKSLSKTGGKKEKTLYTLKSQPDTF